MAIHTDILAFLRDAQYRIGELTFQINDELIIGEIESPKRKHKLRIELLAFIEVLYEINWGIKNGYNLILTTDNPIVYATGWTEDIITAEMQYLRSKAGMVDLPLMSFGPYWTDVINVITPLPGGPSGIGTGLNITGTFGQFIMFDLSNTAIAIDIDNYAGMLLNETINEYFAGRL